MRALAFALDPALPSTQSSEIGISCRGDVPFVEEISCTIERESIGGRPYFAATWSVGSTPASSQNVAYQSAMCTYALVVVPRSDAARMPPLTKAAARTPPSQFEALPPSRGQLLAPAPWGNDGSELQYTGPPLSLEKTRRVRDHICLDMRALVTFPRISSQTEHWPAYNRRSSYQLNGYRFAKRSGGSRGVCEDAGARYMKSGCTSGS
jgi:hypothetical protein